MRARYFPRERELKVFNEAGEELYSLYNVIELRFGADWYYLEIPENSHYENDVAQVAEVENEFYSLAASPENPENTYAINRSLAKFKGLTPVALRIGKELINDYAKIRSQWLRELKALEKSIAKSVQQAIGADEENACQWRGVVRR